MSANDDFSLHDDEELSLHDDASLDGSVPATNKGDAPAKPPQIITTNTLSNIKLPVLQKDDYDTWAMEMEHYLEYIDNEVWKVIQNGKTFKEAMSQNIQKKSSSSLTSDNVAFLSQAKVSSSKQKPSHNSGSYSSYNTSSSKATTPATPGLADEVIHSFLATNADDVDLIHEDLDQIDDLDLEEMDINWQIAMTAIKIKKFYKKTGRRPRVDGKMHVAFDKRKVECFNCHNTGHFARECKFKGSKEGSRQEAGRSQNFKPVQTEKEALMTIDEGQINWVEQTEDEEPSCANGYHCIKKLESQLRASHKQQSSLNEKLYFQANQIFEKDEKLKKYRRIGMKAVKDKDVLQKNCLGYSVKSNAEVLGYEEEMDRATSSTAYSTCQSNDSDGELGAVTDHSVNNDQIPTPSIEQVTIATLKTQPQVSKPKQTVVPSCAQHVKLPRQPLRTPQTPSPIHTNNRQNWNQQMERELGVGYSFERKNMFFVCRRQTTPTWTNTDRVNKANQFTPRPVQLSNFRPNLSTDSRTINTGRVNVNTARVNVNTARVDVNTGHGNVSSVSSAGTHIKSGSSRVNTGKQNINSGSVHVNTARVNRPVSNQTSQCQEWATAVKNLKQVCGRRTTIPRLPIPIDHPLKHMEHRGIFDSGCSGHMTGNRAHLEDYQELSKEGSVTFGGSKGSISGKGTIRLGNLVFDDVAFVKELGHFNLFSISQICDKKLNVLFTEKECFVVSSDFKMPDEN
ncbi:ribonuclease H-like domain-containing protein [Tanacetum coccineum]